MGSLSRPSSAFAPFYMINDLINSGLSKKKKKKGKRLISSGTHKKKKNLENKQAKSLTRWEPIPDSLTALLHYSFIN